MAQYRKTETKPLRQVVYFISGINPALSKPSHGFPLVCKALGKKNRQFRSVIRNRRILRLNFDGLEFYFSITNKNIYLLCRTTLLLNESTAWTTWRCHFRKKFTQGHFSVTTHQAFGGELQRVTQDACWEVKLRYTIKKIQAKPVKVLIKQWESFDFASDLIG